MYKYKALLKRVIDGDTIDVFIDLGFDVTVTKRLRLADIDTPELRSKDADERVKALAAKDFVETTLGSYPLEIHTRRTRTGKERTSFGRYVADVYIIRPDSASLLGTNVKAFLLNQEIVEAGHGVIV